MYCLVLQQHRESLSKLQERWPTPLASAVCYASQACTAMTVAVSLAGAVTPLDLQWLSPILCTLPVDTFNEDVGLPLVDFDPTEHVLDADQIALADILEDTEAHPSADKEDPCDVEDLKKTHSVDFVWQIPFVSLIKIWPYLVTFALQSLAVDRLDINTDTLIICRVFARHV